MKYLEDVMKDYGFNIKGSINYQLYGKFQRFKNENTNKSSKDIFVVLHENRGATFGDWHDKDSFVTYWYKDNINSNNIEIKSLKIRNEQQKKESQKKRLISESRAKKFWGKYSCDQDPNDHRYVKKKRINPYYARTKKDLLLVPIQDIDYEFKTLQMIYPDGFKRLWKGTSQKDLMIWLCEKLPGNYEDKIYVCEGYATGCTIRETTLSPVVCAINANNLVNVCILLKRKYFHAKIIICADNDQWGKKNSGLECAIEAQKIINCEIKLPDFFKLEFTDKPTDFNDLFCLAGMDETYKQLV